MGEHSKIFAKVYAAFWESGLGGKLGAERGYTLLAIASFMDEEFVCWPTIKRLAEILDVSRQTANKRVQNLLAFRWNGEPVITKVKRQNGAWGNNVYRLSDWCQIAIFKGEPSPIASCVILDTKHVDTTNIEKARAAKMERSKASQARD